MKSYYDYLPFNIASSFSTLITTPTKGGKSPKIILRIAA